MLKTDLFVLFLFLVLDGINGLSLGTNGSALDVSIDCGASRDENSPVLKILTDVDITVVARCQGGDQNFFSDDLVHYILRGAFRTEENRCLFHRRENSEHFAIEFEIQYGIQGSLILTKEKTLTAICNFGDYGSDMSPQHSIRDGPIAAIEIQKIVGDEVPSSDLTLSIQTVDDQDSLGALALDRKYTIFGTYTGDRTGVGLKPVSCDAVSSGGQSYSVLRAGCGDGLIFRKSDGFTTSGTTFRSPYFLAFHLSTSTDLAFDCNVTLCTPSCDGSSCEINCGTVTPVTDTVLSGCTGELYDDTCTFVCDTGFDQTGDGIATCGPDGLWSTPVIDCTPTQ